MMVLVSSMIYQINCLQGTARVINYAGIIRGATQREVKLEIVGQRNDDLLAYLDEMKRLDMEIASEFITMASHLMLIKTKMLRKSTAFGNPDLKPQTL